MKICYVWITCDTYSKKISMVEQRILKTAIWTKNIKNRYITFSNKISDVDFRYSIFTFQHYQVYDIQKITYLSPPNADISGHIHPSMIVSGVDKIQNDIQIRDFWISRQVY